ncbi:hypothetical protein PSQ90_04905 [Devosia rhodophyticola]|uniref:Uncharacterized protein n=1 Tax=Devosia rhodophyticola TaxID=3026423 RepID=A0ABY7YZM4_9HYPH|nr:hypothetical protein [Devosia rhodophyticola]WDR06794.1 hypothetical protein PSQ90_04905 [Devosia rhodophyticola]
MSLRGPQAMASLDEAMRDIRREEDEISKRLARSGERVSKIRESEADLVRELAKMRLDPAIQSELQGHISNAESKARDMLKAHASELSATEKALAVIDDKLGALTAERAKALKTQTARQVELDRLAASIASDMESNKVYVEQRDSAVQLLDTANQSMAKTEQAETDREDKGRPYRDDPLFMYLWENGYGTKNYRANNLIRYLDGLVARRIGFAKARPNFAMLNEIPLRLREHAENQIAAAQASQSKVEALQMTAVDAAGGKPVRAQIAAAQQQIEAIDEKITAAEDERDATAKNLSLLAQGADPAFEQALSTLAASLLREDIQTLLAEARRTATGRDDTLVAQIDDARMRVKDEDNETREQRQRLKTLAARRRELEDIQWEFKKSRFDDPRSSFGEERLVGDLLNEFLRGGITAANYWDQWRRSQNFNQDSPWSGGGSRGPAGGSNSPWGERGGSTINWPNGSFGGGRGSGSSGTGGGWSRGGSMGGGFSRPRSGSSGGGFKTGGGSGKSGGFKTGGGV